ncbi:MAG TPA: flagellin [Clostridia bacterium]|nr:flagellin [Clostridia bacterium]
MALSILNNIPSLAAQNQLSITGASLQKTLFRLSSGSRINSGADDAAGLAIADGLRANVTALTQSARNAADGVGMLQVADGALAQVTTLLNRAVTLAAESSTSTVSDSQRTALNAEFTAIKDEIHRIGTSTTFNGQTIFTSSSTVADTNKWASTNGSAIDSTTAIAENAVLTITDTKTGQQKTYTAGAAETVGTMMAKIQTDIDSGDLQMSMAISGGKLTFTDSAGDSSLFITTDAVALGGSVDHATKSAGGAASVYIGDGSTSATISTSLGKLDGDSIGFTGTPVDLSADTLSDATSAQAALNKINAAIANVASDRGSIGAGINRLQSATNVINAQVQNLSAAEDGIRAADIAQEVANMTKFSILNQTGISALAQANQMQQGVLSLLR